MSALLLLSALAMPAQGACTALSGPEAKVWLPDGTGRDVAVVMVDDRIDAVGTLSELVVDEAGKAATWKGQPCDHIDITGMVVTPGFIEVTGSLGLVEVGLEHGTVQGDPGVADPIRAAFRVVDAYNPLSSLIPVTRVSGVTSAVSAPSGGRVAGQGAWVDLAGATQAQAVVDPSVAMFASIGGSSPAQGLRELRELLDDARWYARHGDAVERNAARPLRAAPRDLAALGPVIDGEQPLVIRADRASDIEAVLRFAAQEGVELVIQGGAEAWMLADQLAAAHVAVAVDPTVYGPGSWGQIHARPNNAAILAGAGVQVIISGGWTHNSRLLPQLAGNAVRGGLSEKDAILAVTLNPATAFGASEHGRIAPGARANLVVWGGDPFELDTPIEALFIRGEPIEQRSRQTELRDRYRQLPGSPVPPLELP